MKSNMGRIMLVNPPIERTLKSAGNDTCFPPLNLIRVASIMKTTLPELKPEIMIVDGGIHSKNEIMKKIDDFMPGIAGIGVLAGTHQNGLEIANHAHNRGATTVLGNDHANSFAFEIRKREEIDYIVKAENGGLPFAYIVGLENGIQQEGKPGIFRDKASGKKAAEIVKGAGKKNSHGWDSIAVPETDVPDVIDELGLVNQNDLEKYWSNYNARYGHLHKEKRRTSILNNSRGCSNLKNPCTYCGIYDLSLYNRPPEKFWKTVEAQNHSHGINFFFEVCDNFLSMPRYVKSLLNAMDLAHIEPVKKDIEFEVYVRADSVLVHQDSVKWLKKMNVTRANLGIDANDDGVLDGIRKNMSKKLCLSPTEINWQAVKKLADAGITIHMSFTLGAPGETQKSLNMAVNFVENAIKLFPKKIAMVEASEMVPLPGSASWEMAVSWAGTQGLATNGEPRSEWLFKGQKDILNKAAIVNDWLAAFTSVNREMVEDAKEKIRKIAGKCGVVGLIF